MDALGKGEYMNQLTVASHNHKIQTWKDRIKECRASSLTVADWCLDHNISSKSYYNWMRKIKSDAFDALSAEQKSKLLPEKTDAAFTQITIAQRTTDNSWAIRLHIRDILLEIQNGADSQTIELTLSAIENLC